MNIKTTKIDQDEAEVEIEGKIVIIRSTEEEFRRKLRKLIDEFAI